MENVTIAEDANDDSKQMLEERMDTMEEGTQVCNVLVHVSGP